MDDAIVFMSQWVTKHPGTEFAFRMVQEASGLLGYTCMLGVALPLKPGQEQKDRKLVSCKRALTHVEMVTDVTAMFKYVWMTLAHEVITASELIL